jgi:hypothetical protein
MSDRWLKPDFQEIGISGECTAYAGTQGACEADNHGIITVEPLEPKKSADTPFGQGQITTASSPWNH